MEHREEEGGEEDADRLSDPLRQGLLQDPPKHDLFADRADQGHQQSLTEKGKPDLATGSTKMAFKLADEQQRKDVIAYIDKFSDKK